MKPTPAQVHQIVALAELTPHEEVCGYILNGEVVQVPNLVNDPRAGFRVEHPLSASCVWHSHIEGDGDFSVEDIKAAKESLTPYFLYCVKTKKTQYFDPNHTPSYLGREFHPNWQNCYTLMQDWYRQELKVELPDYYLRYPNAYEHEDVGYSAELPKNGFREVRDDEEIRRHDVVLMYEGCPYRNHVAIVTNPDKNEIIHHLFGHLSRPGIFGRARRDKAQIWRLRSR